mmetsp:Transcript_8093/g.20104  ORF Transcript_8093/g.20104 Transcript_8093/m.20104 type:complete len:210 (+) Transcript_8093:513-1142(+)
MLRRQCRSHSHAHARQRRPPRQEQRQHDPAALRGRRRALGRRAPAAERDEGAEEGGPQRGEPRQGHPPPLGLLRGARAGCAYSSRGGGGCERSQQGLQHSAARGVRGGAHGRRQAPAVERGQRADVQQGSVGGVPLGVCKWAPGRYEGVAAQRSQPARQDEQGGDPPSLRRRQGRPRDVQDPWGAWGGHADGQYGGQRRDSPRRRGGPC